MATEVLRLTDFPRKFREIARELSKAGWCDLSLETHGYADMLQAAIETELGLGESREPLQRVTYVDRNKEETT